MELQKAGTDAQSARQPVFIFLFRRIAQQERILLFSVSRRKIPPHSENVSDISGSARRSPASLHTIHDSSILTDYRSFSSGVDDYYTASGQSVSASYSFRNAQSGIFLMAMGSYGWNRSEYGTVQNVVGDYVFHSYRAQPSDSRNAMAMLNASKTLDFMRGQSASGEFPPDRQQSALPGSPYRLQERRLHAVAFHKWQHNEFSELESPVYVEPLIVENLRHVATQFRLLRLFGRDHADALPPCHLNHRRRILSQPDRGREIQGDADA